MSELMIGLVFGSVLGMTLMALVGIAEWERGYRAGHRDERAQR